MSVSDSEIPVVVVGRCDGYLPAFLAGCAEIGVRVLAMVANEHPAPERARLAQGTCRELHMTVPVGVGADVAGRPWAVALGARYAQPPERLDGPQLLVEALRGAEPRTVRLVLTSALTDAAWLLKRPGVRHMHSVTILADVSFDERFGRWMPIDDGVDLQAAAAVFNALQQPEWDVPVRIVTDRAVRAGCQIEPRLLADLADGGHPVATWLHRAAVTGSMHFGDVVAGLAAIEDRFFRWSSRDAQPHVFVAGESDELPGVPGPDQLTARIARALHLAFAGSVTGN
jgi:hypothetical protein